jgi:predicted metalloendopeptidase
MPLSTRRKAHEKIDSIVKNVGVPDFVLDEDKLNAYYTGLTIADDAKFDDIMKAVQKFWNKKQLAKLAKTQIEREEFAFEK